MKQIFKSLTLSIVALCAFNSSAIAQGFEKVAVIDMKELFDNYHLTKIAQDQVKKDQAQISEENKQKLKEIQKIAEQMSELTKKIEEATTNDAQKKKLHGERQLLGNKGNAMESNRREWLRRRNQAINENIVTEMRKIIDQINEKVNAYARDNNIDIVFDKSARGATQTKVLVFVKDQYDVTEILLKRLNEGTEKK